jgi:hypothetical protein
MKREELEGKLNDHLDGELSGEECAEMELALSRDRTLAREFEALRRVVGASRELPRSVEPSRDLWPEIESRLRRNKVLRFAIPRLDRRILAVAALVAMFVAGLLTGLLRPGRAPEIAQETPGVAAPRSQAPSLDQLDAEYAAASESLFRVLASEPNVLDSETIEVIRGNLVIIEESVREIRRALEENPEDPRLGRLLNESYRQRGDLLRRARTL